MPLPKLPRSWAGIASPLPQLQKRSGKSRQWVHRLFSGSESLKIELMGYLFDNWYEQNLRLMAKRLPLNETIKLSFNILLNESPHMLNSLRRLFGESGECEKNVYAQGRSAIEELWMPLWREAHCIADSKAVAATAILFWGSIALAGLVQSGEVSKVEAETTLIAMASGLGTSP